MPGYKQSPTLAVIDQAFLTRRRIRRHVESLITILIIVALASARSRREYLWIGLIGIIALALVRPALRRLIDSLVPEMVRARLPYGPLDAREMSGAAHTYGDLLQIWRDPGYRCNHHRNLGVPVAAPTRDIVVWGVAVFIVAALGIAGEAAFARHTPGLATVAASSLAAQIALTAAWNRVLRKKAVDLPTTADVWIYFIFAAGVSLVGLAIVLAG